MGSNIAYAPSYRLYQAWVPTGMVVLGRHGVTHRLLLGFAADGGREHPRSTFRLLLTNGAQGRGSTRQSSQSGAAKSQRYQGIESRGKEAVAGSEEEKETEEVDITLSR
jgi:hypothetical protein